MICLEDTGYQVATINGDIIRWVVEVFHGSADVDLDLFGCTFSDQEAMIAAQSFHDIGGEFITGDTDTLVANDTCQGYHGDTGGTTADIDDHVTNGFFYIDADTRGLLPSAQWIRYTSLAPACSALSRTARFPLR